MTAPKIHIHWRRTPHDSYQWVTTVCGISEWNYDLTTDDPSESTCRACLNSVQKRVENALTRA